MRGGPVEGHEGRTCGEDLWKDLWKEAGSLDILDGILPQKLDGILPQKLDGILHACGSEAAHARAQGRACAAWPWLWSTRAAWPRGSTHGHAAARMATRQHRRAWDWSEADGHYVVGGGRLAHGVCWRQREASPVEAPPAVEARRAVEARQHRRRPCPRPHRPAQAAAHTYVRRIRTRAALLSEGSCNHASSAPITCIVCNHPFGPRLWLQLSPGESWASERGGEEGTHLIATPIDRTFARVPEQ